MLIPIETYIENWKKAHEILFNDLKYINNKFIFAYEDLIANISDVLTNIENFLDLKFDNKSFFIINSNTKYYNDITHYTEYEKLCDKYGYSIKKYKIYPSQHYLNNLINR